MTTEDHAARVEQILSEARESAMVATTWTCSMDSDGANHFVAVPQPYSWWNRFSVGWVAGLLFCLALDVLFS